MKKFLLVLPIVVMLSAGCNSFSTNQQTSGNTQPTQRTQTTPTRQQQIAQNSTPTPPGQTTQQKDTSNCINSKNKYELTLPQGWQVLARGEGEARPATCSAGVDSYFFAKDFFNNSFHNQINLQVMTAKNQSKSFWTGFNSLNI